MELKGFHCQIINPQEIVSKQRAMDQEIPVVRCLDESIIERNFMQIKEDVQGLVFSEMQRLLDDPELSHLVVSK